MKTIICVLAAGLILLALGGPSAQAGVIMLLTQNTWEGSNPTPPAGSPDDAFVAWLQGQGHSVVKRVVSSAISAATLTTEANSAGAQLIIIGPRNTSSYYTDKGINAIPIPMLALMAHVIRPAQMDWVASTSGADNIAWTTEIVVRPTHPWVAGLSSTWFTYPTGIGDTRWSTQVETDTVNHMVGNGTVIALRDGTVVPTNATNPVEFAVWEKGTPFYSGTTQTPAETRVFLGVTDWARYYSGYQCSFDNLTADGKEVLRRTINGIIPEPATMALLGLGLGGMLLRRRSR